MPSSHEQRQLHFQIIGNCRESGVMGLPWCIGNISGSCVVRVVYTAGKYSVTCKAPTAVGLSSRPATSPLNRPVVRLKRVTAGEPLRGFSWNVTLVMFTTSRRVTALWIAPDSCDLMCTSRRDCLLKQGTEGTIEGMGWRERRRKRLLNDLKNENVSG
jgi:hypothetical protein